MPLSRRNADVEAAHRTIQVAFNELERAVLPADSRSFGGETLDGVKKAILELENQLASRSSLRNMRRLLPFLSGLQYYSKTIEVLCNGTPYLPWLWAPVKVILKVSLDLEDLVA